MRDLCWNKQRQYKIVFVVFLNISLILFIVFDENQSWQFVCIEMILVESMNNCHFWQERRKKHNSFIEFLRSFFDDSSLKRRFQNEMINDDNEEIIIEILRQFRQSSNECRRF
jgi:hypothetical protein